MNTADLIVRGRQILAGDSPEAPAPAAIHIRHGVVSGVAAYDDVPAGAPVYDAGDFVVMPGLVDTHVHINEPGRTEWEGFTTATRAAAAGGVTSLIEMPLNSIPATTTDSAFHEKLAAAAGKLSVDTGFWGGVVPGNAAHLAALWRDGVFGFKCFLAPSGVPEFPFVAEGDLREAMPILAELRAPLLAHAELAATLDTALTATANKSPQRHDTWLTSRPHEAEEHAIALLVRLARQFKVHVHVVHVSSASGLEILRDAKAEGLAITAETCPHYLTFAAEEIADGATQFKCAPPIREKENQDRLWEALGDGTLDFIATDHSPCPPEMKKADSGDFLAAWGGIASLELGLAAVWTSARQRGYPVSRLPAWLCRGPAKLAGLDHHKGNIAAGCDADMVVWDGNAKFAVEPEKLHQRHKLTPYAGRELFGVVQATFLRGRKIFERGEFLSGPVGNILKRADS